MKEKLKAHIKLLHKIPPSPLQFKPIRGYEELYLIREDGEVFSIRRNRYLTLEITKAGYKRALLCKKQKEIKFLCHRLVASHFLPYYDLSLTVNHIDGNTQNNHYSNLEWCTQGENNTHAFRTGLKDNKHRYKPVINLTTGEVFASVQDAAKSCNRCDSTLTSHLAGETKHCANNEWNFLKPEHRKK